MFLGTTRTDRTSRTRGGHIVRQERGPPGLLGIYRGVFRPDNPRHPTTWHTREYGLHAANIFGLHDYDPKNTPKGAGDLTLEAGKNLTFKYRTLFHTGDAASAKLDERYKDWLAGK